MISSYSTIKLYLTFPSQLNFVFFFFLYTIILINFTCLFSFALYFYLFIMTLPQPGFHVGDTVTEHATSRFAGQSGRFRPSAFAVLFIFSLLSLVVFCFENSLIFFFFATRVSISLLAGLGFRRRNDGS